MGGWNFHAISAVRTSILLPHVSPIQHSISISISISIIVSVSVSNLHVRFVTIWVQQSGGIRNEPASQWTMNQSTLMSHIPTSYGTVPFPFVWWSIEFDDLFSVSMLGFQFMLKGTALHTPSLHLTAGYTTQHNSTQHNTHTTPIILGTCCAMIVHRGAYCTCSLSTWCDLPCLAC